MANRSQLRLFCQWITSTLRVFFVSDRSWIPCSRPTTAGYERARIKRWKCSKVKKKKSRKDLALLHVHVPSAEGVIVGACRSKKAAICLINASSMIPEYRLKSTNVQDERRVECRLIRGNCAHTCGGCGGWCCSYGRRMDERKVQRSENGKGECR